jgi:uncharacterized protein (TIGR03083 family)
MDPYDLLATVPVSSAALGASAHVAGLGAAVPGCPGWTVERLVGHTGLVHRRVTETVRTGSLPPPSTEEPPAGAAVLEWFAEAAAELVAACAGADPAAPVQNWAGAPPRVAFWCRRVAHETAVHAWDAASAGPGAPDAIAPALAADGIDELLVLLLPRVLKRDGPVPAPAATLHVHCTDTPGEWTVELRPDGVIVRGEHARGDAALRGPASDLLLTLCNRLDAGEVLGDTGVMSAWRESVHF